MRIAAEELLLADRMAPITSNVGFVEAPAEAVCEAFVDGQRPLLARRDVELTAEAVGGDLEAVLRRLLPLTNVERRRYLFVPTRSRWSAFFDNGHQGTDVFAPVSFLSQEQGWRGLRVLAVPHTYRRDGSGRYGGLALELYGPSPPADEFGHIRSIDLINDGGRWSFGVSGDPLPFEREEAYHARRKTDRFSLDLLAEYLEHLGVHAFDASWYMPPGEQALLVAKHGPASERLREFTLAEAQRA